MSSPSRCVRHKLTGLLTACTKAGLGQGASSFQWLLPPISNVFRNPSPPIPQGWPLSWVKQVIQFPEDKLNELRGLDATLYLLFLRACSMSIILFTCLQVVSHVPSFSTICSAAYIHYGSHPSPHTYSLFGQFSLSTLHDARIHFIPGRNHRRDETSLDTYHPSTLRRSVLDCISYLDLSRCVSISQGADSTRRRELRLRYTRPE